MLRFSAMDQIRKMFFKKKDDHGGALDSDYAPIVDERMPLALEDEDSNGYAASSLLEGDSEAEAPFSWFEYSIFALLGVAMLWAWNMFLAAAPYFQTRFASDPWILANFQPTITSTSTVTNLAAMLILTNIQYSASYPFRINTALIMNVIIFGLLTASTSVFLHASPLMYLIFLVVMISGSAWACGLIQNGAFAYAASFGHPEYTQAIMAGQGVAGVLPPLAQMFSVLVFPVSAPDSTAPPTEADPNTLNHDAVAEAATSAFFYFLTAVCISVCALVAFQPLMRRHDRLVETRMAQAMSESLASIEDAERAARKVVSLKTLFLKLHWLALAVFGCFLISMFFPVLTPKVQSVTMPKPTSGISAPAPTGPAILQPSAFIPLAFFFWNLGDLLGRMSTMLPAPTMFHERPVLLFAFATARLLFLPMYFLCNLGGRGAVVNSDLFYLLLLQLPYGLSSGWLSSTSMMAASEWVEDGEREAAGSFMGMCLVAGLACGSFLSFSVSQI